MVYIPLNALALATRGVGCVAYFDKDAAGVCRPTNYAEIPSATAIGTTLATISGLPSTAACVNFCWSNTAKGIIQPSITFDFKGGICSCIKPGSSATYVASTLSTSWALVLGNCASNGGIRPCSSFIYPTTCPLYYGFDVTHYCNPSTFARFVGFDLPPSTPLLLQGWGYHTSTTANSEGECLSACLAGSPPTLQLAPSPFRAFSWTVTGGCKCADSTVQASTTQFVSSPLTVMNLIGNCAKYNMPSSFGCEDVICTGSQAVYQYSFTSATCAETPSGLPCKCLDPNTQTCSPTGVSLICNPNYTLNGNNLCIYNPPAYTGFARYIGYASFGNDIPGVNGAVPTYLSSMPESFCASSCRALGTCVSFASTPAACSLKSASSSSAAPFVAAPGIVTSIVGTCKSNNMMVQGVLIPCEDVKFRGLACALFSDGITPCKCPPYYSVDPATNFCKPTQYARFINYNLQGVVGLATTTVPTTEITCPASCQSSIARYSVVWNSISSLCSCGSSAAASIMPLFVVSPGSAVDILGSCVNYPLYGTSGLAFCEDVTYNPTTGCRRILDGNTCACLTGQVPSSNGDGRCQTAPVVSNIKPTPCPWFAYSTSCDSNGNPLCPFQWGLNPDKNNPGCIKCLGYDPSRATTLTPTNSNTCSCDIHGVCGLITLPGYEPIPQLQIIQCNHQYAHLSSKTSTGQVNESCSLCPKGYIALNVADYQASQCCLAGFTWMGGESSGCTLS